MFSSTSEDPTYVENSLTTSTRGSTSLKSTFSSTKSNSERGIQSMNR
ncbi:hypothetical protein LINPERPRIM_LOCUS3899 [Linum perenne]